MAVARPLWILNSMWIIHPLGPFAGLHVIQGQLCGGSREIQSGDITPIRRPARTEQSRGPGENGDLSFIQVKNSDIRGIRTVRLPREYQPTAIRRPSRVPFRCVLRE